jgi:hypothetical protein
MRTAGMESERQPHYFTPTERMAFMNAGVVLSEKDVSLSSQVEASLAKEGTIVPGSRFDIPRKNVLTKVLSLIKK